jgi:ComF family protein
MQNALALLFPPRCLACDAATVSDFGLCAACWTDTAFIGGLVCDTCGTPLPGEDTGHPEHCDDCLTLGRPWSKGRAALLYSGTGRRLILALKHGDRTDIARPAAAWLARAGAPLLMPDTLIAPIPLHPVRLFMRRFNQSALLADALARLTGLSPCPDLLRRRRRTPSQEGRDRDARFANVAGAIDVAPRHRGRVDGRRVLLVDDVMTSGATFAAAADALATAGAASVSVLALARVAKDA